MSCSEMAIFWPSSVGFARRAARNEPGLISLKVDTLRSVAWCVVDENWRAAKGLNSCAPDMEYFFRTRFWLPEPYHTLLKRAKLPGNSIDLLFLCQSWSPFQWSHCQAPMVELTEIKRTPIPWKVLKLYGSEFFRFFGWAKKDLGSDKGRWVKNRPKLQSWTDPSKGQLRLVTHADWKSNGLQGEI